MADATDLEQGSSPAASSDSLSSSSLDAKVPSRKKSVLSMAARFEQDSAPPPQPPTVKGTRSFSSRSLTDSVTSSSASPPKVSPALSQGSFDESTSSNAAAASPPVKRAPIIIPKTFSDMRKAGETVSHVTDGQNSGTRFRSLKLSRFNEFVEHDPQAKPETEQIAKKEPTNTSQDSLNASPTSTSLQQFDEYNDSSLPSQSNVSNSPNSSSHYITRSVSSSSTAKESSTFQSFPHNIDSDSTSVPSEAFEAPTNLPAAHSSTPSIASYSSIPSRTPSVTLKPIIQEEDKNEDDNIIFAVCVVGFHHIRYGS